MSNKESGSFAAVPDVDNIQSRVAQMWFIAALGKGGAQLIQLASLAVLARLLLPADFGMVAMVMAVIGVAGIFSDMGLSAATIRARALTPGQASTLLILNVCFGLVVSVALYFAAPLLMHIYDNPDAVSLARFLSWTFLVNSVGAQHLALLRRQLKFLLLAKMNLFAITVGQSIAVLLALQGFSFWSIAWGMMISAVVKVAVVWLSSSWRPSAPEVSKELKSMVGFGGYLVIFALLGYVAMQAHNILIGAQYGAQEVGYYSRAFAIMTLLLGYVTGPMDSVAPAALARMVNKPADYQESYLHMLSMMLLLAAPVGFICFLAAPEIISLLLGPQWIGAVVVLQILGLAAIPQTLCNSSGWLYQSHGDSRSMMIWGFGGWGTLIALLYWGTSYGIQGVAIAYAGGMLLLVCPCLYLAFRRVDLSVFSLFQPCAPLVLAAAAGVAPILLIEPQILSWPPSLRLGVIVGLYGVSYLIALLMLGQRELLDSLWRQLLKKGA